MLLQLVLTFVLGLCFGSFINVFVDRLQTHESFVFGKSHCDHCRKDLTALELIPLLSFIFPGGKCKHCKKKLSFYYPFSEFMTGILFSFTFYFVYSHFGLSIINLVFYLFIISSFTSIFLSDLKYEIIPDKVTYPSILICLAYDLFYGNLPFLNYLFSAIGAFGFFLVLVLVTKGKGMGIGDLKLTILMGFLLGFPKTLMALYLAFLTGAVVAIILILWRKKSFHGSTIPFGPFLVFGAIVTLFFYQFISPIIFANLF